MTTNLSCAFPNTDSAANAVLRWIRRTGVPLELTARPWNRFNPVNTEWWLIPSTDWPAYRHGKLFFGTRNSRGDLFCGLFIEKGLGSAVGAAFPTGKRLVMDRTWIWHRLIEELGAGSLAAAIAEVHRRTECPVIVDLDGGFVEDPASYEPDAPGMDWNRLLFESDSAGLRSIWASVKGEQFSELPGCRTLPELAEAILRMPHRDWCWVNVHVGLYLRMAPLEGGSEAAAGGWEEEDLWRNCLEPWKPWVI